MQWLETIIMNQPNAHLLIRYTRTNLCLKKTSRMDLRLQEYGHLIPRPWMKKLECEVYTTSVHILNENNDNFNVRL